MTDKKRIVIGPVEELPPGARRIITVSGREIGIFNVGGEFFALRNICPHMGAPICHGRTRPYITWNESTKIEPDAVEFGREGEILKCPWHLWEFDLRTGKSMHDETLQVRTYHVVQEGTAIVLYL